MYFVIANQINAKALTLLFTILTFETELYFT